MAHEPTQPPHDDASFAQPTDEEMRAAYEAELNRITSTEMLLQTTVSLLNIGGRRLGLAAPSDPSDPAAPNPDSTASGGGRDLEQVRDAIDGVRALMPILERHMSAELGPLRDALSQLQMAYAHEIQATRDHAAPSAQAAEPVKPPSPADPGAKGENPAKPGPAESSGRLWVPGR